MEGFNELFPPGRKILSATASASGPERRTTASPPSPSGVAMAAIVSSNMGASYRLEDPGGKGLDVSPSHMPATPRGILRLPPLQKQPRLFVTFLVQVMEQGRIGVPG